MLSSSRSDQKNAKLLKNAESASPLVVAVQHARDSPPELERCTPCRKLALARNKPANSISTLFSSLSPHEIMSIESTAPTTSLFPSSFSAVLVKLPAPKLDADPTILYSLIHRPSKPKNTLVLLHGYPQNHTLWHTVAAKLPLEDWNIIIPDLPGCVSVQFGLSLLLI